MKRQAPSKEVLDQVRAEIEEHLSAIEGILLQLEEKPGDPNLQKELFRRLHTIKGISGILEIEGLVEVAHIAENYLEEVQHQNRDFQPEEFDFFLSVSDIMKSSLSGREVRSEELLGNFPQLKLSLAGSEPAPRAVETEAAAVSGPGKEKTDEEANKDAFLLFQIEERLCGFPIESIREISLLLPWRRIPFAPLALCGVTSLRGQLIPVLDLPMLVGLPSSAGNKSRILFLEVNGELVGFVVDRVVGVSKLQGWEESRKALRHFGMSQIQAVGRIDDKIAAVLNPRGLWDPVS